MIKNIKIVIAGLLMVPVMALGISLSTPLVETASAQATSIQNGVIDATPAGTNTTDIKVVFKNIVNIALYIIGALAVLMLIYGGIRYTVSGGDTTAVTAAKNTILYAIIGIIVAILAFAIVNFVIGSFV